VTCNSITGCDVRNPSFVCPVCIDLLCISKVGRNLTSWSLRKKPNHCKASQPRPPHALALTAHQAAQPIVQNSGLHKYSSGNFSRYLVWAQRMQFFSLTGTPEQYHSLKLFTTKWNHICGDRTPRLLMTNSYLETCLSRA